MYLVQARDRQIRPAVETLDDVLHSLRDREILQILAADSLIKKPCNLRELCLRSRFGH